jgi:hypothetical protein
MKKLLFILLFAYVPLLCFGITANHPSITFSSEILLIANYVLLVVSLFSLRFFFWPGEENRMVFQLLNMLFTAGFYIVALRFIILHNNYYVGYEGLTPAECIKRFFLSYDLSMVVQWVILFSFLINIIYVIKYAKNYYMDLT